MARNNFFKVLATGAIFSRFVRQGMGGNNRFISHDSRVHTTPTSFFASSIVAWLLIVCVLPDIHAQRVRHLDINNGLCTNSLTDLTLDRHGNMWIGSYNGLMKYSGTHIKCLNSIGNSEDELSGPEMHSVTEDQCGFIWIGTTAGLDKINPVTFEIEHYPIKSPFPGASSVGYIYSVYADRFDFLWFSTDVALFRLDIITGHYEAVPEGENEYSIPHHYILYNGYLEREDGLWFSTNGGMVFYEYKTRHYYHQFHNPFSNPIFNTNRTTPDFQSDLEVDGQGKMWFIYEHHWLGSYDFATQKLDTFSFKKPEDTWNCCWSMGVDEQENIWIGTRHGGIFIFNSITKTFSSLKEDGINRLIQSDYIYAIERGPEGHMFVSHDNGLDIIDVYDLSLRESTISDRTGFMNLKHESGEISFDAKEEAIFLPFHNFGFLTYNILEDEFSEFEVIQSLDDGVSLIQVINGKTYAGFQRNMREIEIRDSSFEIFEKDILPRIVTEGRGEVIWYFSQSPDASYVMKSNGKIYHIHNEGVEVLTSGGFKPNVCISPDSQYLNYLTPQQNLVRRKLDTRVDDTLQLQEKLIKTSFSFSNPRHMTDDGKSVWMTGQNGILRYNYGDDSLSHYGIDKGLSHSFTFSVVQDTHRRVWVGGMGGIDMYDSASDRFVSIYKMKENTYMSAFGHAICSKKGDLFFQFGNKLIYLNADKGQTDLPGSIGMRLHEVLVNGDNIDWTQDQTLDHLSYQENMLTFIYDVLLYDNSDLVSFEYRLNGKDWINNEKRNEINLAALSSGSYLLEVRCSAGAMSNDIKTISIPFHINPPWWKQWWFIALISASMISFIYFYYKGRINKYRKELRIARQISEIEAKALRAQMNPHFVFNSLNAIQECIVTGRIEEAYTYLSKFSRLLRLVLEHSDAAEVSLQEELEVLSLYVSLEKLRFKNDMEYQLNLEDELETEEIIISPMLIQPHLENAIWHGLRHKEGNKKLVLSFTENIPGYLEVIVEDNGIGRDRSASFKQNMLGGSRHKSKGSQLSENRLDILRKSYPETKLEIIDLYNSQGDAIGTQVRMVVPMLKKSVPN